MKPALQWMLLCACVSAVCGNCSHGSVRLVNGATANQGRLEVCIGQSWGTVCQEGFDVNDAKVVCHQLGYDVDLPVPAAVTYKAAHYGQGSGPVWLRDLQCTGSEQTLLQCSSKYPINTNSCGHNLDVGLACSSTPCVNDSVRLIGGLVSSEGIVHMCVGGRWRALCSDGWGYQEAFVVCRQLGMAATAAEVIDSAQFGIPRSSDPLYSNFRCYGNESSPSKCLYNSSSCTSLDRTDAAVRCAGDTVSGGRCFDDVIRLVGPTGPSTVEGRVEYCSNGLWGTIDDYNFDIRDGQVVCRRLGYQQPGVQLLGSVEGTGPIFFSDLNCTGTEFTLRDCPHLSRQAYFSNHSSDVGIRCLRREIKPCTEGAVRMTNGSTADEGRVEICVNNEEWWSVYDLDWDQREAQVVCRQLGYNPSWAIHYRNSNFGDGEQPVLVQSFNCIGNETSLSRCEKITLDFSHSFFGRVAGVRCFKEHCDHGAVRLVDGRTEMEGSVQICVNGVWGYVCTNIQHFFLSDLFSNFAKVVCRQLGYSTRLFSRYTFNGIDMSVPTIYGSVLCDGTEENFLECERTVYYETQCQENDHVYGGVMCQNVTNCTSGDVQLVNGTSDADGRVEICYNGEWSGVIGEEFFHGSARVVCRQFGFHESWAVPISDSHFGIGRSPAYVILCSGMEPSLQACQNLEINHMFPLQLAFFQGGSGSVECQKKSVNLTILCTTEGAVRLSNGSTIREGRLEVCQDGYWGTVCNDPWSDSWSEEEAYVVCRQTGVNTIRAVAVTDGRFGKGVGPVYVGNVECQGTEMRLVDCNNVTTQALIGCHHGRDVGVLCEVSPPRHFEVTVDVHPPQDTYMVGSVVTLLCNVSPAPVEPFTYNWRTTVPDASMAHVSDTSPNVTVTIQPSHSKYGYYYCTVSQMKNTIATGVAKIEVKDILQPEVPVPLMVAVGSNATLRVSVAETDKNRYLRELTWYHNGVKIDLASSTRFGLSSDNTSLTICSVTDRDAGEYSVQYDGLRLYPYDDGCERQALDLLRHYPLLAPAVLFLTTDGKVPSNHARNRARLSLVSVDKHTQAFNSSTASITLAANIDLHEQYTIDDRSPIQWFRNGIPLSSTTFIFHPYIDQQSKVTLQNPTWLDIGVYETQLRTNLSEYLICNSPTSYIGFIGTNISIIGNDVQKLLYSETPAVEFKALDNFLPATEATTLTCMASEGYPPVETVAVYKNNKELISSSSSSVLLHVQQQYTSNTINGSQYGIYKCLVDNGVMTVEEEILLQEEAQMIITFQVDDCSAWDISEVAEFETALSKYFTPFSGQDVSLRNSSLLCGSSSLNFTFTVVYSSSDGTLTASQLIGQMNAQLASERDPALVVNGALLRFGDGSNQDMDINMLNSTLRSTTPLPVISTTYSLPYSSTSRSHISSLSSAVTNALLPSAVSLFPGSSSGEFAGLFLGGVAVASLIWLALMFLTILLIWKYRKDKNLCTKKAKKDKESSPVYYNAHNVNEAPVTSGEILQSPVYYNSDSPIVTLVHHSPVYSNSDSQFVTAARLPDIPANVYSYASEAEHSASVATYGNVEEDTTVIYEQLDAVVMDGQEERIEGEPEYTDMD